MKDHWTLISDPLEAQALLLNGKYREDKPTLISRQDGLWVLVDAQLQKWRETSGKRS